jgi:thiol:disulfide interchange protein
VLSAAAVGCARLLPAASPVAAGGGIGAILGAHRPAGADRDFLPPDDAFRFGAFADGPDRVRLVWQIANGYYLYRSRIAVRTPSPRVQLGRLELPSGRRRATNISANRRSISASSWRTADRRAPPAPHPMYSSR